MERLRKIDRLWSETLKVLDHGLYSGIDRGLFVYSAQMEMEVSIDLGPTTTLV